MSDYGMKVSQVGVDVLTSADNQYVFSSAFGGLLIKDNVTINSGGTYTHNYGYIPVYTAEAFFTPNTQTAGLNVGADSTKIYNNSSNNLRFFLFARDIRTNLSGVNITNTPSPVSSANLDYGFKVSSDGYNVKTTGLTNLVSFSGVSLAGNPVRQLIIHQTGFQDNINSGTTLNISHNLGYVPQFWAYYRKHPTVIYSPEMVNYQVNFDSTVSITYQATVSSSEISFYNNLGSQIDVAYVIFKDAI